MIKIDRLILNRFQKVPGCSLWNLHPCMVVSSLKVEVTHEIKVIIESLYIVRYRVGLK